MPRKGAILPKPVIGDPNDPDGMAAYLNRYLDWLQINNYSKATIKGREHYPGVFIVWCDERSLKRPNEIIKPILERYQRHLYLHRKKDGEPLSFRNQHSHLVPVRAWFKWLTRQNHILYNPASELDLPRLEKRLPKHVLTQAEAETVLNQTDTNDALGIRDRAMLETLYSTGMRRMELIGLKLYDIDVDRGTVMIRQGKGKKDRMIPIGDRALAWIDKYLAEVRPELVAGIDDGVLYLTNLSEPFTPNRLTQLVRNYVQSAGIGKTGARHLFRHTMATLMLEHGADIHFIQEMLGHADVSTTQIYTQVSIRQLQEIHTATHPARLEKQQDKRPADNAEQGENEEQADELLSTLAAESEADPEPQG
ncbi:MAG: site-specific tyrosine recombinase XerC [Gammaproteobacteria bacterium]|nr:site-specific tyrosine recombinase XerC [Gammaproteobacteria bacterium]